MSQSSTDPIALFERWYREAQASESINPGAMTLATATPEGRPSARMVLLKGHGAEGFEFYTNLNSAKVAELEANPFAALCFYWKTLARQVRISGPIEPVAEDRANAYFASRERGSQIGAWASDQSQPLASRALLENRAEEYEAKFAAGDIPRPSFWSGYRVVPDSIEFWTQRDDRLHDRQLFERTADGGWRESWLYP
ncbi:MAG: pyridoxamine 5'-phosphate oxidase [Alphaproteobacteria bacterium]|nr:pyridoxamine 5'-phosphate oxidase [Alphaproteobacteria bacterium]MCZ6510277.1 pyridoxamine 5'-phosphate oxidase [Alphaproteobacteria bacterium]MCZ6588269.1 pyridoxamine 5'-phosphate oxidase [Alphaproteobacteria bacterium]MCZ6593194.1 pyridoxamine 5'-phosphate oxidase [Alphaproteobacteria bacterium]MCZ6844363.1 pyridoxamine 5'-phosphate oxidase [Alphaproteobacteria bacterium]